MVFSVKAGPDTTVLLNVGYPGGDDCSLSGGKRGVDGVEEDPIGPVVSYRGQDILLFSVELLYCLLPDPLHLLHAEGLRSPHHPVRRLIRLLPAVLFGSPEVGRAQWRSRIFKVNKKIVSHKFFNDKLLLGSLFISGIWSSGSNGVQDYKREFVIIENLP